MKFDILPIPQHYHQQQYQQHYLTIEDIKSTRNSCWLCGCNWLEDHVSLDCSECGGYALTRPCVNCDGKCGETWQRDISRSHDSHRARFLGRCRLHPNRPDKQRQHTTTSDSDSDSDDDETQHHLAMLGLDKSDRIAQLLRATRSKRTTAMLTPTSTTTMTTTTTTTSKAPYQQQQHLASRVTNKTTNTATNNTASSTNNISTSSCCSSHPSSATNSDEDQDN